jgi:hypothetical protein
MGYSARRENVLLCLAALESVLRREGWVTGAGAGVDAAVAYYAEAAGGGASGREAAGVDESLGAPGIGSV